MRFEVRTSSATASLETDSLELTSTDSETSDVTTPSNSEAAPSNNTFIVSARSETETYVATIEGTTPTNL